MMNVFVGYRNYLTVNWKGTKFNDKKKVRDKQKIRKQFVRNVRMLNY